MSVRQAEPNLLDLIRNLKEDVDGLKSQMGATRMNSIRLGDWVLEVEADELVKMTNLKTGVVSYIGAPGESSDSVTTVEVARFELPPFSVSGVIRNVFGGAIRTNNYIVGQDITVNKIYATLAVLDPDGPTFHIYVNDVLRFNSGELASTYTEFTPSTPIEMSPGDSVYLRIPDDGNGTSVGLTVMMRQE